MGFLTGPWKTGRFQIESLEFAEVGCRQRDVLGNSNWSHVKRTNWMKLDNIFGCRFCARDGEPVSSSLSHRCWMADGYPATMGKCAVVKSHDAKSTMAKSVMAIPVSSLDGEGYPSTAQWLQQGRQHSSDSHTRKHLHLHHCRLGIRFGLFVCKIDFFQFLSSKTFTRYIPMLQGGHFKALHTVKLSELHKHLIPAEWIAQGTNCRSKALHCR